VTALLAAIVLHDEQFGARARRGDWSALVRCYLTRFLLFVGAVLIIGGASGVLGTTPPGAVAVLPASGAWAQADRLIAPSAASRKRFIGKSLRRRLVGLLAKAVIAAIVAWPTGLPAARGRIVQPRGWCRACNCLSCSRATSV